MPAKKNPKEHYHYYAASSWGWLLNTQVPQVYGLERPAHDRQNLIFWLINGSLILNIVS